MADGASALLPFAPAGGVRVIVPAKRLDAAKSRLRPILDAAQREALVLGMLHQVIEAAGAARGVNGVAVITADARIAADAEAQGARLIFDDGRDLNDSLRRAVSDPWVAAGSGWLILPGDLPQLTPEAVDRLLAAVDAPGRMAVTPDQHRTGTSALAWRGAPFTGFRFGPGSFEAHQASGRDAGFTVVARPPEPAFFDLDDLDGLERFSAQRPPAVLRAMPSLEPHPHA